MLVTLRRGFLLVALVAVSMFLVSSSSAEEPSSPIGAKHVVMIGYDGFGGHYVHWDELPTLRKLRDGGAWTLQMRCVLPSSSAINWASMLMGADSELHGFRTWGSKAPDLPSRVLTENGLFPCIFHTIKMNCPESMLCCAYDWEGIGYLFDQSATVAADGTKNSRQCENDDQVCEQGLEYLALNPTFAFIYFGQPDGTGHDIGWGTPEYYQTVQKLDVLLGRIVDYLEANDRFKDTLIIFVSDHGGTDKGHGGEIMEHMEVPFIAYGCGVKQGELTDVVVNYDVAATIAWALGVKAPQAWRGQPVLQAFGK